MPEPEDDLALLEACVRAGGQIALGFYGGAYKCWSKDGGSPVTEADLAVNTYLRDTLMAARPDYGWLSEESADDPARLSKALTFVVDPIDGTIAFLKQRPHFTVCVGIVLQGRAVCGAIYNPVEDTLYSARLGAGAHRNGVAIQVGTRARLEGCAMLGDRDQLAQPPWPPMDVQNRNSVAWRLMLVADGSMDACASLSAKCDWDLAAGDIIMREAGGCISDVTGAPLTYNRASTRQPSLAAANPTLHAEIVALQQP